MSRFMGNKEQLERMSDQLQRMGSAADGGPAYPFALTEDTLVWIGMSMRDWFAGQALIGILSGKYPVAVDKEFTAVHIAEDAYQMADAMIQHRKITHG